LKKPATAFLLTAYNSQQAASTNQGRTLLASAGQLPKRDLAGPYAIGVQGNYGTEYWNGDIAELILFARTLSETERVAVWNYLANRYQLKLDEQTDDPQHLALASLCHVLMNTNEFLYID